MIARICIGSSCHLKGSEQIVELFKKAITDNHLENEITLAGSFCTGQCNRVGVTIMLNDDIYIGNTPETFPTFFKEKVLETLKQERAEFNGMSNS